MRQPRFDSEWLFRLFMKENSRVHPSIVWLSIFTAVYALGYAEAYATNAGIAGWYLAAKKPLWGPPLWSFVVASTVLHAPLAASLCLLGQSQAENLRPKRKLATSLLWIEVALWLGWAWLFFFAHSTRFSVVALAVEIPITLLSLWTASRVNPITLPALLPQLLWRSYLFALNIAVLMMNAPNGKS